MRLATYPPPSQVNATSSAARGTLANAGAAERNVGWPTPPGRVALPRLISQAVLMLLTYDPSKDLAYIELADEWKGPRGGSNFANIPVEEGISI